MNRHLLEALGVAAMFTIAIGSCKSDPLADLDGTPAALVVSFNHLEIRLGDTVRLTGSVVDGRTTPLPLPVTFSACDAVVVTTADTSYHPVPATSSAARVTALIAAPSCVVAHGAGFEDTVTVAGVPVVFPGALSSTAPKGGDTLKIASTAQLKFNPATVAVTFGGGTAGIVVAATADTARVLVPFSSPGPLTIAGIRVPTFTPPRSATLPTTATVTQTGDFWGTGDTGYVTAPDLPIPAAAATSTRLITNFGADNDANCAEVAGPTPADTSTGPCVIYKFTLAAPTDLKFVATWTSNGNVDVYTCGSAGKSACFEGGNVSGRTTKTTETISTSTYAAGTHYFVIELFSGAKPSNIFVTITRP